MIARQPIRSRLLKGESPRPIRTATVVIVAGSLRQPGHPVSAGILPAHGAVSGQDATSV